MSKEFETGNYEYAVIDLHNHSSYSEEYPKTTFNEVEMLEYFEQVAEKAKQKVCFSVTDHDTALGAFMVYKELMKNKDKYPLVDFVPGMELNMSLERVAMYNDGVLKDPSFVFKKCHMLIHAKEGREEEFFKRTFLYSTLAHKKISVKNRANSKIINIGKQILAARNKLNEVYSIRIPLGIYRDCASDNNFSSIRATFLNKTIEFLFVHEKIIDETFAEEEIKRIIERLFPDYPTYIDDFGYYGRFSVFDLKPIFDDCATFCYAHPQTLSFKKFTKIPVKLFKNVDISTLPRTIQQKIKAKLNDRYEFENGYFSQQDILFSGGIYGDQSGLVKLQLLHNQLQKYGIKIDGYELTPKTATYKHKHYTLETIADTVVDKMHLLLNFGTDKHYDNADKMLMQYNDTRYYETNKRTKENPYLKYNRLNRQLTNDENSFTIGVELER